MNFIVEEHKSTINVFSDRGRELVCCDTSFVANDGLFRTCRKSFGAPVHKASTLNEGP